MGHCSRHMFHTIASVRVILFIIKNLVTVLCKYLLKKKILIDQHVKPPFLIRKYEKLKQTSCSPQQKEFNKDLCSALISCNFLLTKLNNGNFKSFLHKYCKQTIPHESTLRKNYVNSCYNKTMLKIKRLIADNCIYLIVDESTNKCGCYIAHLFIGLLHDNILGKS